MLPAIFSYGVNRARFGRKRHQPSIPYQPSARQRLIPILPPAILYRCCPGVIEGGFGEGAEVDGCQLAILVFGECLGHAVRHMRQQPISQPFSFGDGLVHQRLAVGSDHRLAQFRTILRLGSGSYQSCRPLSRRDRRWLWRKESSRFPTADPMDTHLLMSKDVGLLIRLEKTLRDEFVAACHANDRPADELRAVNREGAE